MRGKWKEKFERLKIIESEANLEEEARKGKTKRREGKDTIAVSDGVVK